MKFPTARGPASESLVTLLRGSAENQAEDFSPFLNSVASGIAQTQGMLADEDLQLTLFILYELHCSGVAQADEKWEWNPDLFTARGQLESVFEQELRAAVVLPELNACTSDAVAEVLFAMAAVDTGPSMPRLVATAATAATVKQLQEFLIHKSIYQLKEADPHTRTIPRLTGRSKAAMLEIQADEYGGGRPERMHSALFARTMRGFGLDEDYGAYVDAVSALTLAGTNMMSMFGLNRRLRAATVGHLAAYEMTSSQPNRLYGNGFRRHGFKEDFTGYFDEHVEADAVHAQIAGRDLAGGLFDSEPAFLTDIYFGAAAAIALDARSTQRKPPPMTKMPSASKEELNVSGSTDQAHVHVRDTSIPEIVACPNGPLLVHGDFEIVSTTGNALSRRRKTVALYRCGASGIKPYCDGTHKLIGFRSGPENG